MTTNRVLPPSHTLPVGISFQMRVMHQVAALNRHINNGLAVLLFVIVRRLGSCLSSSGDGLREVNDETKENRRLYPA
jgi:hypothetical protein